MVQLFGVLPSSQEYAHFQSELNPGVICSFSDFQIMLLLLHYFEFYPWTFLDAMDGKGWKVVAFFNSYLS